MNVMQSFYQKLKANPYILVAIIFCFQLGVFLIITTHPFSVQPLDRRYLINRGQITYASYIRQAAAGAWKLELPYTTRPSPAVYAHQFFVVLGKIAAICHIDPVMMYMYSRIGAGVLIFLATFFLITVILPRAWWNLAIIFTLFLETGPLISTISTNLSKITPSIFSYYVQVVSLRHFGLSHHTSGEAFGLLLFALVFLTVKKPGIFKYLLIAVLTAVGTLTLTSYNLILSYAVIVPWIVWSLAKGKFKQLVVPATIIFVIILAIGLFLKYQFSLGYPWKDFYLDEKRWVTDKDFLLNYFSSLLLYLPLIAALWAVLPFIWKKISGPVRLLIFLTSCWIVLPITLLPFSRFAWFPLANFRLMDGYGYLPAGILATISFNTIKNLFKPTKVREITGKLVIFIVMASSLFLTYVYSNNILSEQKNIWTNVYLLNDEWQAIDFLGKLPQNSGIMVTKPLGEIIPDYALVRVYLGATPGDVEWEERFRIAIHFYQGQMTTSGVLQMLKTENVDYVYLGPDEKKINQTDLNLYPEILKPVFQNPAVTVYQVIK